MKSQTEPLSQRQSNPALQLLALVAIGLPLSLAPAGHAAPNGPDQTVTPPAAVFLADNAPALEDHAQEAQLENALIRNTWTWIVEGANPAPGLELRFGPNGELIAAIGGPHWLWRIAGAQRVVILDDHGNSTNLNFDEHLDSFFTTGFDHAHQIRGSRQHAVTAAQLQSEGFTPDYLTAHHWRYRTNDQAGGTSRQPGSSTKIEFTAPAPAPSGRAAPRVVRAAPSTKLSNNGGLNRGAYDHRYIWTWGRWVWR